MRPMLRGGALAALAVLLLLGPLAAAAAADPGPARPASLGPGVTAAATAAYTISAGGTNWQPWTTYLNGDYAGRLAEARAAVARLGGGGGVTGTVIGGGAPLTVRSGPGTGYAAVGSVVDGSTVTILCQTRGQSITGPYGATALWDRIGAGRYVTDAYVFTGSNGQVARTC